MEEVERFSDLPREIIEGEVPIYILPYNDLVKYCVSSGEMRCKTDEFWLGKIEFDLQRKFEQLMRDEEFLDEEDEEVIEGETKEEKEQRRKQEKEAYARNRALHEYFDEVVHAGYPILLKYLLSNYEIFPGEIRRELVQVVTTRDENPIIVSLLLNQFTPPKGFNRIDSLKNFLNQNGFDSTTIDNFEKIYKETKHIFSPFLLMLHILATMYDNLETAKIIENHPQFRIIDLSRGKKYYIPAIRKLLAEGIDDIITIFVRTTAFGEKLEVIGQIKKKLSKYNIEQEKIMRITRNIVKNDKELSLYLRG